MDERTSAAWKALSQDARNAAYNNGASVGGSEPWQRRWNDASARLRAQAGVHLDVSYGPRDRNKWDIFPGEPGKPCLVFIHGGYWQRNSRETFACMIEGVRAHGWSAALPGYTLAPEITLTELVSELHTAFDWLGASALSHGIGGSFIVSGWSAGGHLTAMLLEHPLVAAGLAISGVYDLAPVRDTHLNPALQLTDTEIDTLSPLRRPVSPKPLTIAYGSNELPALVASSRDLHDVRSMAGARGTLMPLKPHHHFSILDEFIAPDGRLTMAALALAKG